MQPGKFLWSRPDWLFVTYLINSVFLLIAETDVFALARRHFAEIREK